MAKKTKYSKYAGLIKDVALQISDERSSKCGYDLMMGLETGDVEARFNAWKRYLLEYKNNDAHMDTQRDGVWVPAIPYKG